MIDQELLIDRKPGSVYKRVLQVLDIPTRSKLFKNMFKGINLVAKRANALKDMSQNW
jgi:hypothetical protein